MRVITIIDRPSIEVIDAKSSIWRVLGVPVASSPCLPLWRKTHGLSLRHAPPREVLTSDQSRECRGQGDGKDRSRPDAEAASWRLPKARAGYHGCGNHGRSSGRSPRSLRTSDPPTPRLDSCNGQLPYHCAPDPIQGLEPKQTQDLLHRDLSADSVEVYAWHDCSSLDHATTRRPEDRSVPFLSMGNGNDPSWMVSPGVANQRACGKAGRLVRVTPAPRPGARS